MSSVYTIPAGAAFLKSLARGLLRLYPTADDPFALARVTVFLPTQRSVRALEESFLDALGTKTSAALVLPRIRTLGEADEEEIAFAADDDDEAIPPAVSPTQRLLRLAECLRPLTGDLETALAWAGSLARLLDEALIEEADLSKLGADLPQDLARHFERSRAFLEIIGRNWPSILAEDGVIERIERRKRLMDARIAAWKKNAPGPVYAAGSTGTIPATQRLMRAVLDLPEGGIVLPGLDIELDEGGWNAAGDTHPQAGLKRLLSGLGLSREEVLLWPYIEERIPPARRRLLSEALRPAPTTDTWASALASWSREEAVSGLSIVIARDRAEEARAIALAMREALEQPAKTAALVTPDRALARRVAGELGRWGIEIDDSAGVPLLDTAPALFLRLLLAAVESDFAPVPLLSLLKHPNFRVLTEWEEERRALSALERFALRGARPPPGFEGIRFALENARADDDSDQKKEALRLALAFCDALEAALRPLASEPSGTRSVAGWTASLITAAEACARGLWKGSAGEAVSALVGEIAEAKGPLLSLREFRLLVDQTGAGRALRPRTRTHPRLAIWGLLEARLQSADLLILGGLNEGVWPQVPDIDPWANRTMREAIGLGAPERWIGVAAHDFEALAAGANVILTAAEKVDGSPVKRSRFLLRLENFLKRQEQPRTAWQSWAQAIVRAGVARPVKAPQPCPAPDLRPTTFRITDIKTLRRDPYAIYARCVLGLKKLDPVEADTAAADRGTLFHAILEAFVKRFPDRLPVNAREELVAMGDRQIAEHVSAEEAAQVLRGRFRRMAGRYLKWESEHRAAARNAAVEIQGEIPLDVAGRRILLRGRVDRVDIERETGGLIVFDYKTGRTPSKRQVELMLDPQLPLSALLVQRANLVEAQGLARLGYLRVGGSNAAIDKVRFDQAAAVELIAKTEAGLCALLAKYARPDQPYVSWAIQERQEDKGDYDLLARVAEWRAAEDEEEW